MAVDCDRTFDGRWVLSGEMNAEHGALIGGAITAQVDAMFKAGVFTTDDGLSPAERWGQALAEVIAQRAQPRMRHGRPRPSVEVICDERTLLGVPVTDPDLDDGDDLASRVCVFADRTPMALTTLSRLLCGAEVHRIVIGADGEVLDVGKTSRLATRAQRRALAHRHAGQCAFPGCEAPFDWCEMHHIQPWQPGPDDPRGPTDLANLVPLCALHHHRVHDEGFTITVRPDGTTQAQRPGPGRCPITPARAHPKLPAVHPDTTRARARIDALVARASAHRGA